MFHFDGRADTYVNYFRCLRDAVGVDVLCACVNGDVEMVFGSDEEKAMVFALKQVFPEAKHVLCMQHIEENVRRFLTDKVGAAVSDREAVVARVRGAGDMETNDTFNGEERLSELMETARRVAASTDNAAKLLSYVNDKLIPKLRNNMAVVRDHGWVTRHWTNNNAESVNHLLKLKADWRQLPIPAIVDNIYDMVKLSLVDLRVSSQLVPKTTRTLPTRTQVNSYPTPTRTQDNSYPIPTRTQVNSYPIPSRTQVNSYPIPTRTQVNSYPIPSRTQSGYMLIKPDEYECGDSEDGEDDELSCVIRESAGDCV